MYQQELARSGEALFKVRGHYLTGVVVIGTAIAWFSGATGPFESDVANQFWFWVSLALASLTVCSLRRFTNTFDGIS